MFLNKKQTGIVNGKFMACPSSPNCVSTQSKNWIHYMEPIRFNTTSVEIMGRLKDVISGFRNGKIVGEKDDYLHVEFRSRLFGFVDDAEFYADDREKLLHFKSVARLGFYDLGQNRKRMAKIINLLHYP